MFGIGWAELLVVAVVALLVLGPDKLPEAARLAGQAYSRLQRTLAEARAGLKTEMDLTAALNQRPPDPPSERAASHPPLSRPGPEAGSGHDPRP